MHGLILLKRRAWAANTSQLWDLSNLRAADSHGSCSLARQLTQLADGPFPSLFGGSRAFHRVLVPGEGMRVTEDSVADSSTDGELRGTFNTPPGI